MSASPVGGAVRGPGETDEALAARVAAMIAEELAGSQPVGGAASGYPDEDGYYFLERT